MPVLAARSQAVPSAPGRRRGRRAVAQRAQRPDERLAVGHGEARAEHRRAQLRVLAAGHDGVGRGDADVLAAAGGDRRVDPVERARVVGQRERDAEDLLARGALGRGDRCCALAVVIGARSLTIASHNASPTARVARLAPRRDGYARRDDRRSGLLARQARPADRATRASRALARALAHRARRRRARPQRLRARRRPRCTSWRGSTSSCPGRAPTCATRRGRRRRSRERRPRSSSTWPRSRSCGARSTSRARPTRRT